MTIYEMYGRLMEERQQEHEAHMKTIDLLARIKAGRVSIEQVVLTPDSWRVLDGPPAEARGIMEDLGRARELIDEAKELEAERLTNNGRV